jgi:hypothetical protein
VQYILAEKTTVQAASSLTRFFLTPNSVVRSDRIVPKPGVNSLVERAWERIRTNPVHGPILNGMANMITKNSGERWNRVMVKHRTRDFSRRVARLRSTMKLTVPLLPSVFFLHRTMAQVNCGSRVRRDLTTFQPQRPYLWRPLLLMLMPFRYLPLYPILTERSQHRQS